jgi:hypothetical protein
MIVTTYDKGSGGAGGDSHSPVLPTAGQLGAMTGWLVGLMVWG